MRIGFGRDLLPFRVGAERGPVLVGLLAAGVGNDVDQGVLGALGILGHPVADALHAVALEDLDGVIAEAGFQRLQLALVAGVGAEFENAVLREGATADQGE